MFPRNVWKDSRRLHRYRIITLAIRTALNLVPAKLQANWLQIKSQTILSNRKRLVQPKQNSKVLPIKIIRNYRQHLMRVNMVFTSDTIVMRSIRVTIRCVWPSQVRQSMCWAVSAPIVARTVVRPWMCANIWRMRRPIVGKMRLLMIMRRPTMWCIDQNHHNPSTIHINRPPTSINIVNTIPHRAYGHNTPALVRFIQKNISTPKNLHIITITITHINRLQHNIHHIQCTCRRHPPHRHHFGCQRPKKIDTANLFVEPFCGFR